MRLARTKNLLWAYGLLVALGIAFGVLALGQLRATTGQLEEVVSGHAERVILVERLRAASERSGRAARGYMLTGNLRFQEELKQSQGDFHRLEEALSSRVSDAESARRLASIRQLAEQHEAALSRLVDAPREAQSPANLAWLRERLAQPLRDRLDAALAQLVLDETSAFREANRAARQSASNATKWLGAAAAVALLLSVALTVLLVRSRSRLEQSHERLEDINRDLDAFAGRIAHDLRNILAPVSLQAATLRLQATDAAAVEKAADRLQRMAKRSEGLIEALLAFARAAQPQDALAAASVRAAIHDAVEDQSSLASTHDVRVRVEAQELSVACSPSLLHTVLVNLLGNALKFLEGQPRREVCISARSVGLGCEIVVEDTGPGIPPEAQPKLFAPFYRVPGSKVPGTGIGLATVQRIVQAHHGSVSVRSEAGLGATFTVRLPLREEGASIALPRSRGNFSPPPPCLGET